MKKKLTRILLVCLLLAAAAVLTACGEQPEPAQETAPAAAEQLAPEAPAPAEPEEPAEPEIEEAPAQTEPEQPEASEGSGVLETALSFVDQDAALLLEALGEPQEKLYEASCSGPGDDGIWVYDGVTVFTYLENGVETVVDAE